MYRFNTNVGKNTDLWEDDASFFEKLGKSVLVIGLALPALIWALICSEDDFKKELIKSLNEFSDDLKKQISNSKKKLHETFSAMKKNLLLDSNNG